MIKRIIIIAYVLVGLVLFKFAFTYGYNEWVISKYEEENYDENFSLLEVANFNEPYIVYYNNGNVMYKRQDYEEAIKYYETALEKDPPEGKECPVRINLALAKLALLGDDAMAPENLEETIKVLKECLYILSEEECATDDGNGHNNRAQRLYDEIKEMLEQAEQQQESSNQDQSQNSDQNNQSDQSNSDQSNSDQSQNSDQSNQSDQSNSDQSNSDQSDTSNGDPSDGSSSDPSDGSGNGSSETTMSDEEKRQSESLEKRQSQIEDEMERRMSDSNDKRQSDRKKSLEDMDDWNWDYDEVPVW
ncbi:MAG: tetratricopeptide repeat protein [Clostridiales bacterium]|nr:tetratricopeptide repeat protein [Clostridiales bacterium]